MAGGAVLIGASPRTVRRRLDQIGNELAVHVREKRAAVTAFLVNGTLLRYATPGSSKHEQLTRLEGSLAIGTYSFANLNAQAWDELEATMKEDLEAAFTEFIAGAPGGAARGR